MDSVQSQTVPRVTLSEVATIEPFNPFLPGFRDDPYPVYRRYRERDPMHRIEPLSPDGLPVWYLFRYADVARALRDPRVGREWRRLRPPDEMPPSPGPNSFGAMAGNWMLFRDPPDHTRLRSLANRAFTPKAMAALRPRIEEIADDLIDQALDQGTDMDLIADYAFPLPVVVIAHLLGVPSEDRAFFRGWSVALAMAIDLQETSDPEIIARADRAVGELIAYLQGIVAERRRQPRDDLISALLASEDEGTRLSEDELLATCVLLLVAGHETTVNLIGNGTLALLRHPDQLGLLRANPSRTQQAVDELLRYDSPVQLTFRVVFEDLSVGGQTIRRGEEIGFVLGAANHDPERYPDPDRLDVTRDAGRSCAFGMGIHYCLGAPLARLEGEVAFARLVQRFPGLRLATDAPAWRSGIALRGLACLPVSW